MSSGTVTFDTVIELGGEITSKSDTYFLEREIGTGITHKINCTIYHPVVGLIPLHIKIRQEFSPAVVWYEIETEAQD